LNRARLPGTRPITYGRKDGLGPRSDAKELLAAWVNAPGIWQSPNRVEEKFSGILELIFWHCLSIRIAALRCIPMNGS
jgi:hypothetical protein